MYAFYSLVCLPGGAERHEADGDIRDPRGGDLPSDRGPGGGRQLHGVS